MKKARDLVWRSASRQQLADHLAKGEIQESGSIGGALVYRCLHGDESSLALSLENGQALIIELEPPPPNPFAERRRKLQAASKTG